MYLDALSDLVAAYEDQYYAIEPASDAAVIPEFLEKSACRIAIVKCRVAMPPFKNKASQK